MTEPTDGLNQRYITQGLHDYPIEVNVFDTVTSTNDVVKDYITPTAYHAAIAETQTAGRGRQGRVWHSPKGKNIYCSLGFIWPSVPHTLSGLPLAISLAIIDALVRVGFEDRLKIKWPNDIFFSDAKLAGILVETTSLAKNQQQVVTGIGINCNSNEDDLSLLTQKAISLAMIKGSEQVREPIIVALLRSVIESLEQFKVQGLAPIVARWPQYDFMRDKKITLRQSTTSWQGRSLGIDERGYLLLCDEKQEVHAFSSGEVTW